MHDLTQILFRVIDDALIMPIILEPISKPMSLELQLFTHTI